MSTKLPVGSLLEAFEDILELMTVDKLDLLDALSDILELTTAEKPDVVKVVDPD